MDHVLKKVYFKDANYYLGIRIDKEPRQVDDKIKKDLEMLHELS